MIGKLASLAPRRIISCCRFGRQFELGHADPDPADHRPKGRFRHVGWPRWMAAISVSSFVQSQVGEHLAAAGPAVRGRIAFAEVAQHGDGHVLGLKAQPSDAMPADDPAMASFSGPVGPTALAQGAVLSASSANRPSVNRYTRLGKNKSRPIFPVKFREVELVDPVGDQEAVQLLAAQGFPTSLDSTGYRRRRL